MLRRDRHILAAVATLAENIEGIGRGHRPRIENRLIRPDHAHLLARMDGESLRRRVSLGLATAHSGNGRIALLAHFHAIFARTKKRHRHLRCVELKRLIFRQPP